MKKFTDDDEIIEKKRRRKPVGRPMRKEDEDDVDMDFIDLPEEGPEIGKSPSDANQSQDRHETKIRRKIMIVEGVRQCNSLHTT